MTIKNGTAYVDLKDIRPLMGGASTICGSGILVSQLDATVKKAAKVKATRYAINGQPRIWEEWLQGYCGKHNDNCDPAPFR